MVKLLIERDGSSIEFVLKDDIDITSASKEDVVPIPLKVRNGKLVVDGKTDLYSLLDIKV